MQQHLLFTVKEFKLQVFRERFFMAALVSARGLHCHCLLHLLLLLCLFRLMLYTSPTCSTQLSCLLFCVGILPRWLLQVITIKSSKTHLSVLGGLFFSKGFEVMTEKAVRLVQLWCCEILRSCLDCQHRFSQWLLKRLLYRRS